MNSAKQFFYVFLILSAGLAPSSSNAYPQEVVQARLVRTGSIEDLRMREASGVATSRDYPGIFWIHNDSGDGPFIFAITIEGQKVATFNVLGAEARDWEDIALGPCPQSGGSCLFIADTGDNNRRHQQASIYIVPEPDPAIGSPDSVVNTARAQRLRFHYEGGDAYDVEAVAVAPDGTITLISKGGRPGSGIVEFRIAPGGVSSGEIQADIVGRLPIVPVRYLGRWVTGAAISPSGDRLVVRTYTELYFFLRGQNGELTLVPPVCWIGASEPQGEAVDFLDEDSVVLVSEKQANRSGTVFTAHCTEE